MLSIFLKNWLPLCFVLNLISVLSGKHQISVKAKTLDLDIKSSQTHRNIPQRRYLTKLKVYRIIHTYAIVKKIKIIKKKQINKTYRKKGKKHVPWDCCLSCI